MASEGFELPSNLGKEEIQSIDLCILFLIFAFLCPSDSSKVIVIPSVSGLHTKHLKWKVACCLVVVVLCVKFHSPRILLSKSQLHV